MNNVVDWLLNTEHDVVPLFWTDDNLVVKLWTSDIQKRKILRRSEEMENAIVRAVENGLDGARNEAWQGLMYVMGKGNFPEFIPLFIGYTEKWGRSDRTKISANIDQIRTNTQKFARWGNGKAYHIGELSQELFRWGAYSEPEAKKREWAQAMFETYDPPRLKEPVYLCIIPWYDDSRTPSGQIRPLVEAVKELICRGHKEFPGKLLNDRRYTNFC